MSEWATDRMDELREQITVLKAERDEMKRQRDEVLQDLTVMLAGWFRCATCEIETSEGIEEELEQIEAMRKKHTP